MNIRLSDHFTYKTLLRYTLPCVVMMIFTSVYTVVDGLFVSNIVGKSAFAAVNLLYPFLMLFPAVGFMIGAGGSALVSKMMGEGKTKDANQVFSMLIWVSALLGVVFAVTGVVLLPTVARFFGAEGEMYDNCLLYGYIIFPATPFYMLQNTFQNFLIASEKPKLGLAVTAISGCTNIVLDALAVLVLRWGLVGAAIATAFSQVLGCMIPLIYFLRSKNGLLRLERSKFRLRAFIKTCTNGASEFLMNVSMAIVGMLYNFQLMRMIGEDGVAAYGVLMYVGFVFIAVFLGYSMGCAPIISYHYGAENKAELHNLYKKSLWIIAVSGFLLTALAEALAMPLALIFTGYDPALMALTQRAFVLYSSSFLFAGWGILGSAFFTALNNGLISGIISVFRALVLQTAAVLLLPLVMGLDGVWLAVVAAEALSFVITLIFLCANKKRYGY